MNEDNKLLNCMINHTIEPNLTFCSNGKELLVITKNGIKFNTENFEDYNPDDFAKEFMKIINEQKYFKKEI